MKNTLSHSIIVNRPVLRLRGAELFHSYLAASSGLSDRESIQRLHLFGKNQIEFHRRRSPLLMLLAVIHRAISAVINGPLWGVC
ncbi:cation-transporting P-type ATPase [Psychromonas ingrahamii]|uniref:cation-transporting P-type ATPase n=1 Tax=Psychromonas ingrahamii TaxID=357794 RepID=UPI0012ED0F2A